MGTDYIHGVETVKVSDGIRTIQEVRTAVIGLVGTAPVHKVDPAVRPAINVPVLVNSEQKAAAFGSELPGYTLPESLDAVFDFGYGTVIAINVFDVEKHRTDVEEAEINIGAEGKIVTGKEYVGKVVVKKATDGTLRELTTDYTVNLVTGEITIINADDIAAGKVLLSYDYADVTKVTAADIIGEVDAVTGKKTGLKALKDVEGLFGFEPKIIIAPGYSSDAAVRAEMETIVDTLRAYGYVDSEVGQTLEDALSARTTPGGAFNTSKQRLFLCWPRVVVYDKETDGEKISFYSARIAGARAKKDREKGYWWSISNTDLTGVLKPEIPVSWSKRDPNCDAQLANAAGICTIINRNGLKIWGPRNASFPNDKGIESFESCFRVGDLIEDSIEEAALERVDAPIDRGFIDEQIESINAFLRKRTGTGNPLAGGECWFEPDLNDSTNLAGGNIVIDYDMAPYPPAERITYRRRVNIGYLQNLAGGN